MSSRLPAGWHIEPRRRVARVVSGGTPSRYVPEFWRDGTVAWVTPTDITGTTGRYLSETREQITERGLRSCSATLLPPGSLLMTSRATLGEIRIAAREVCTNQGFKSLVPIDGTDGDFLYYQMLRSKERYRSFGIGSTFLEVNKRDTERFEVLLAPSEEQPRIAKILSTIDNVIEQTEALIAKTQQIKAGLMHDLFTRGVTSDGRLRPPREEAPKLYRESPLGWIPKEWTVKLIGEFCDVTKLAGFEFTNVIRYDNAGEVIALRALNIKNETLDLSDIQRISRRVSEQLPRSRVRSGDVLITYIGAYIGDVLLIDEDDKYHLAPNVARISVGRPLNPRYVESALRTPALRKQMSALTAVTATPSLTMTQIRKLRVAVPGSPDEQARMLSPLSELSQRLSEERKTLENFNGLKRGLMHDLLTGGVRVPVAETQKVAASV